MAPLIVLIVLSASSPGPVLSRITPSVDLLVTPRRAVVGHAHVPAAGQPVATVSLHAGFRP